MATTDLQVIPRHNVQIDTHAVFHSQNSENRSHLMGISYCPNDQPVADIRSHDQRLQSFPQNYLQPHDCHESMNTDCLISQTATVSTNHQYDPNITSFSQPYVLPNFQQNHQFQCCSVDINMIYSQIQRIEDRLKAVESVIFSHQPSPTPSTANLLNFTGSGGHFVESIAESSNNVNFDPTVSRKHDRLLRRSSLPIQQAPRQIIKVLISVKICRNFSEGILTEHAYLFWKKLHIRLMLSKMKRLGFWKKIFQALIVAQFFP